MGGLISYLVGSSDDEDEIDPETGLTTTQKKLIRECWEIVERNSLEIGIEIMSVFFTKHPEYQEEFPMFRGRELCDLINDRKFHAHCITIMGTFGQAIKFLHEAEICTAGLRMVGERHARRGQDTVAFHLLEPIVNKILKNRLGDKCTARVSEALDIAIGLIMREIKSSIDEHNASKNTSTKEES